MRTNYLKCTFAGLLLMLGIPSPVAAALPSLAFVEQIGKICKITDMAALDREVRRLYPDADDQQAMFARCLLYTYGALAAERAHQGEPYEEPTSGSSDSEASIAVVRKARICHNGYMLPDNDTYLEDIMDAGNMPQRERDDLIVSCVIYGTGYVDRMDELNLESQ